MRIPGLYTKRGWYYFQPPQRNGYRPPAVALETRELSAALEAHRQLVAAGFTANTSLPLAVAVDRYCADARRTGRHSSGQSAILFGNALKSITRHLPAPPVLAGLTPTHIRSWLAAIAPTCSTATIAAYHRRLATVYRWAIRQRLVAVNPFDSAPYRTTPSTRIEQWVSPAQRDSLIAACTHPPLLTVLHLGFHAGMRISEIIEATPAWIQLAGDRGTITIQATATFRPKNRRGRVVPVSTALRAHLLTLDLTGPFLIRPDLTHRGGRLRYNPLTSYKTLAASCGVPWLSFHHMRRSFAAHHAQAGTSIYKIARWLGDSLKVTIENYAALSHHDADIDNAL